MGLQAYPKAEEWQQIFLKEIKHNQRGPTILGLEHPPTITLGRRGQENLDILWSQESLERQKMQVFKSPRGGQATLHTPGQLVIYPLFPIAKFNLTVKDWLCTLVKTTQKTLQQLGIHASSPSESEPGLFTQHGKIAAFGLRIEDGCSYHGLSINNQNELHLFGSIRSCGVSSQAHSRVLDESGPITQPALFNIWREQFLLELVTHSQGHTTECVSR